MHNKMQINIMIVGILTILASFTSISSVAAQAKPSQPNIVVIFSDDHGFQDIRALSAQGQDWIGTYAYSHT